MTSTRVVLITLAIFGVAYCCLFLFRSPETGSGEPVDEAADYQSAEDHTVIESSLESILYDFRPRVDIHPTSYRVRTSQRVEIPPCIGSCDSFIRILRVELTSTGSRASVGYEGPLPASLQSNPDLNAEARDSLQTQSEKLGPPESMSASFVIFKAGGRLTLRCSDAVRTGPCSFALD